MSGESLRNSSSKTVIGVDILPGRSSSSARQPHYAVVILSDNEVIGEYEDVSLSRLIRLIWEYRPAIIALDNVFELAPDEKKLLKLMTLLPPDIELIQVTGWGPQAVNIKAIARSLGVPVHGKPSPLKTAYIAAVAASRGYGYRIRFLEEKTKIIVSKGRSISRGGMSHNRYVRSIRAGILRMTREIKSILDRNKLDYDLVFKKSKGGLERSIFIVYAPRSRLYGLVKPINTKTVRVEIRPVYSSKIAMVASSGASTKALKPVIVGLDPGICTGIAVIDLDGTPLLLYSSKNIDRSDIINMVLSVGNPVLIATDVSTPPEAVKKLAATLHVNIYIPSHDLSNDEKNMIVYNVRKKFPWIEIDDTHERDALAAAYKAYLYYHDKFRQLESELSKIDIPIDQDKIKAAIIKGMTIAEALENEVSKLIEEEFRETSESSDKRRVELQEQVKASKETIARLRKRIKYLEAEKISLQRKIMELKTRIEELETELRALRHTYKPDQELRRFIELIVNENKSLREEVERLRNELDKTIRSRDELIDLINRIFDKDMKYIPMVSSLIIAVLNKVVYRDGSIRAIYIKKISPYTDEVISYLFSERIAIVTHGQEGFLEDRIPIIDIDNYEHYIVGDRVYVDKAIEDEIDKKWKTIEEKLEDERLNKIIRLIEDYRRERKKKLGVEITEELRRIQS